MCIKDKKISTVSWSRGISQYGRKAVKKVRFVDENDGAGNINLFINWISWKSKSVVVRRGVSLLN
jgi:hypothetical protein